MFDDFDPRSTDDPRDSHDIYDPRWNDDPRDRDEAWRERERDRDRERDQDPRDVFLHDLDLPRGLERELVQDERERTYEINGDDSRTLATVGAFRVVSERDMRDPREVERWAFEHDLPYFDDHVHFPDFRIEYQLEERDRHEDIEVLTEHYRGAHAATRALTGFTCYRTGRGGGGGGRSCDPRLAEEFL